MIRINVLKEWENDAEDGWTQQIDWVSSIYKFTQHNESLVAANIIHLQHATVAATVAVAILFSICFIIQFYWVWLRIIIIGNDDGAYEMWTEKNIIYRLIRFTHAHTHTLTHSIESINHKLLYATCTAAVICVYGTSIQLWSMSSSMHSIIQKRRISTDVDIIVGSSGKMLNGGNNT